jgi:hypothetical protein
VRIPVIFLFLGSVETPKRNKLSLPGALFPSCFRPRRPGIPDIAIAIRRLIKKTRKKGVTGMLHVGCLSLRERWAPLLSAVIESANTGKKRISTEPFL